MPKMKTNSSAKKRFKVTGSGKIKRACAYKRHILTKKSTKQIWFPNFNTEVNTSQNFSRTEIYGDNGR